MSDTPDVSALVAELRMEANATEELHPGDSEIDCMRRAATELTRLQDALDAAERRIAEMEEGWSEFAHFKGRAEATKDTEGTAADVELIDQFTTNAMRAGDDYSLTTYGEADELEFHTLKAEILRRMDSTAKDTAEAQVVSLIDDIKCALTIVPAAKLRGVVNAAERVCRAWNNEEDSEAVMIECHEANASLDAAVAALQASRTGEE